MVKRFTGGWLSVADTPFPTVLRPNGTPASADDAYVHCGVVRGWYVPVTFGTPAREVYVRLWPDGRHQIALAGCSFTRSLDVANVTHWRPLATAPLEMPDV